MRILSVGDIAPRLIFPDLNGAKFDLHSDSRAGRVWVLVIYTGGGSSTATELAEFQDLLPQFSQRDAGVVVLARQQNEMVMALSPAATVIAGATAELMQFMGADEASAPGSPGVITILIRPNNHVAEIIRGTGQAASALRRLESLADSTKIHPPILVIPDVFDHEECSELIRAFDTSNAEYVDVYSIKGRRSDVKTRVPDYGRQDRIDLMLNDHTCRHLVTERIQTRLLPELRKAFQFEASAFENLRIARYVGARGGASHGHRDNSAPEVAHRKFAVSINLNSEEFEGGALRFREYGGRRIKPDSGSAVVFSCSLLHEALEVESGVRYVLLLFVL